ncbi:MAG: oligosaccharide flippase family protein [Burkholderiaceae bacterium]
MRPIKNAFSRVATINAALLMTGSTYVVVFLGLLVNSITARALGPDSYGHYAYIVWIAGLIAMIANNGLNTTGIRFISECIGRKKRPAARSVHGWLLRAQWLCLLVATIGFLLALPLTLPVGWREHINVFGIVVVTSAAAKTLYLFYISVGKGYGQYAIEAFSSISGSLANALCILVLFFLGAPLVAYLGIFAVMSVTYTLIAWGMLRRRHILPSSRPVDHELSLRVKNHLGWTVILALAAAFGNKASETYLLSAYVGPAELGFFTIAAGLARGGVELLSSGVNAVLMPLMGHAFGSGGTERVNAILADSVRFFTFAGLLLAGVGFMCADFVILLMYGAQYQPAVIVFRVMVVVAGLTLSQGAFGALLSTTDNQRIRAVAAVVSVALSVVLAVLLVPRYGLNGAMVATALSSLSIFLLLGGGIVKSFAVPIEWRLLGKLMLAAAVAAFIAAGFLWVSPNVVVHLFGGVVYSVLFIVGTFLLRAWTESDMNHLKPLAARYPRIFGRLVPALSRRMRR